MGKAAVELRRLRIGHIGKAAVELRRLLLLPGMSRLGLHARQRRVGDVGKLVVAGGTFCLLLGMLVLLLLGTSRLLGHRPLPLHGDIEAPIHSSMLRIVRFSLRDSPALRTPIHMVPWVCGRPKFCPRDSNLCTGIGRGRPRHLVAGCRTRHPLLGFVLFLQRDIEPFCGPLDWNELGLQDLEVAVAQLPLVCSAMEGAIDAIDITDARLSAKLGPSKGRGSGGSGRWRYDCRNDVSCVALLGVGMRRLVTGARRKRTGGASKAYCFRGAGVGVASSGSKSSKTPPSSAGV
ncbi:hypothetical protein B0T25DRAFT_529793 [Lasiosphaeria hispida]|uniref:Uncharacterized protein n=1 Tax=Lasiosphaeria hispida TaxID=260671 RepID=A0AAJ0HWR3_9PEZI|nr:hypothetical protein B0T25DRAFT_529793 [Lasiosphaeria hispida]